MPGDSTKSMSLQNYKNKCFSAARQLLKSIALWAGLPACLHPLVLSILRCLACMTYRRSAVERAESARQRLVLVGQGATSFHLHYIPLHYTTLHYTTLHSTTLHYTTLHYTTLHLHYIPLLHYTTLHYTTLRYATLRYTTLHYTNYSYNYNYNYNTTFTLLYTTLH